MSNTTEDVKVEVHRTPHPRWEERDGAESLGYVQAEGQGATVILPCSLALLDDHKAVEHYIKTRLLLFHRLEVEKSREAS